MMNFYPFYNYIFATPLFTPTDNRPPSIYDIMNSMANFGVSDDKQIPVSKLAENCHNKIFDFSYPLTNNISKDTFEILILNKFLMRRIGFETFTAFKIQLNVKLNEIMPKYNKLFDALENWDIFNDGEKIVRSGEDTTNTNNTNELTNTAINNTENVSDRRNSNTPQNHLENVRDGSYVTEYNYDTDTVSSNDTSNSKGNSNTDSNRKYYENISHSPSDKISIFKEMQENVNNIYTMIFNDLEDLFYSMP